jgi:hypothetical protein
MFHRLALLAALVLTLTACEETTGDYVEITGGGFLFNYRVADATYGLVATARRTVPAGTVFEAAFENPEGGPPVTARLVSQDGQRRFALNSPPVRGIVKDKDYRATLILQTPEGKMIETHEQTYHAELGSDVLPDKPLTIGPGYTKNPESPQ